MQFLCELHQNNLSEIEKIVLEKSNYYNHFVAKTLKENEEVLQGIN
mgnify:CR=1 FL=1